MIVLDISDLDSVHIGVIAQKINYMAEVVWEDIGTPWDPVESEPPRDEPVPVLEEPRSREPLTYAGFMLKFALYGDPEPWFGGCGHKEWPVIEATALDCRYLAINIANPRLNSFYLEPVN